MPAAVGDQMAMQSALERYEDIDYTFSGSREGKLLKVSHSRDFLVNEHCDVPVGSNCKRMEDVF